MQISGNGCKFELVSDYLITRRISGLKHTNNFINRMVKQENSWVLKDWTVYPKLNLIQNHQSDFSVKPRLMKLLEFFLLHQRKIVTKEAILDYVWEDRIVTENLLAKSISELRKLLDERFPGELEIETIRNVGYRFNPGFEIFPESLVKKKEEPDNLPDSDKNYQHLKRLALALIFGLICLLSFALLNKKTNDKLDISIKRITSLKGQELSPVISPNGQNIAYTWRKNNIDPFHLYVRSLEEDTPRKLSNQIGAEYNPVWSKDGNSVIFFRRVSATKTHLVRHSIIGDDETILADLSEFILNRGMIFIKKYGQLIFSAKKSSEAPYSLFAFDLETSNLRALTDPPLGSTGDLHPALARSENQIAFIRVDNNKPKTSNDITVKSTLYTLDLKTLENSAIAALPNDVRDLIYHPTLKKYLCWVSTALINSRLISIDQEGIIDSLYRPHTGMPGKGALGKDNILYYENWDSDLDVYKYALQEDRSWPDTMINFLDATVWDWGLQLAAETDDMAFLSFRNGYKNIWFAPANKPEMAIQLTDFENFDIKSLSIAPDGKRILFTTQGKEQSTIYSIHSNGQQLIKITASPAEYSKPVWAFDQNAIYYGSNKTGTWSIWKRELSTGEEQLLAERGFVIANSIHHPEFLFYTSAKSDTIFRLDLKTFASEALIFPESMEAENWQVTKKGIYYLSAISSETYLHFFDFATRETKNVKLLNNILPSIAALAISKDGQNIYLAQSTEVSADLMSLKIE